MCANVCVSVSICVSHAFSFDPGFVCFFVLFCFFECVCSFGFWVDYTLRSESLLRVVRSLKKLLSVCNGSVLGST